MKTRIFIFLISCFFTLSSYALAVRIGTPIFQPPFVINLKSLPVQGFDIAIMDQICQRMKWDCQYVPIPGNDFFSALDSNQIDYAIGGIVITPNRSQTYLFSLPYFMSKAGFITLVGSPIKTIDDLKDKRIGALKGKVYSEFLDSHFPLPITPSTYPVYSDLILALKNDEIDAIFLNYDTGLYLAHQHPALVHVLDQNLSVGGGMGIVTTYAHSAEIDQINKILLQNEEDGTFIKLYNYYFEFFIKSGAQIQEQQAN